MFQGFRARVRLFPGKAKGEERRGSGEGKNRERKRERGGNREGENRERDSEGEIFLLP
jgi:hypothetical protein